MFVFDRDLSRPVSDYTKRSRIMLYDSGAVVLQYSNSGPGDYRGAYTDASGALSFRWEGAGPWAATGALEGQFLTIRYNEAMQQADFEDAVYVLMP